MQPEGKLVALAKEYHAYSCREKIAKYTQIGTMSLFILGAGVTAVGLHYEKYLLALGSITSSTAIVLAGIGIGIGRERGRYARKAGDICVEFNILESKLANKDPLSLPVETRQNISEKRDSVARHKF